MELQTDVHLSKLKLDNINKNIIDILENAGLHLTSAVVFYTGPNYNLEIAHVDGNPHRLETEWPSRCKLNYVIGKSETSWYDASPYLRKYSPLSKTIIGNPYQSFNKNELLHICSAELSGWHLFEAGIPHSVSNPYTEPRWCISIPLFKRGTTEHETFNSCKEKLTSINF